MKTGTKKTDREFLSISQRVGELISIVFMLLCFGFFLYHLVAQTGFFTDQFGAWEQFFFFGPMLLAVTAPFARAIIGRRNPARPLEVVTNLFMAAGAYWLLMVFPFNFAHLADALPGAFRFLLAWINNDIGRIPFIIQAIVCPIVALVTAWIYLSHHNRRAPAHAA